MTAERPTSSRYPQTTADPHGPSARGATPPLVSANRHLVSGAAGAISGFTTAEGSAAKGSSRDDNNEAGNEHDGGHAAEEKEKERG
jgi:hypothetical protein